MAQRNWKQALTLGDDLIEIVGAFNCLTGAGTVVAANVKGLGFGYAPVNGVMALKSKASSGITSTPGIVRTGTGLYTITFEDYYNDLNFFSADLACNNTSGTALWAQPVNNASNLAASGLAPTLTLLIVNSSGSPTDATSTSMVIYFAVQFRNGTVGYNKP